MGGGLPWTRDGGGGVEEITRVGVVEGVERGGEEMLSRQIEVGWRGWNCRAGRKST